MKLSSREEIAALSDVHMQKNMKVITDRDRMLLQYTLRRDFQCKIATVLTSLKKCTEADQTNKLQTKRTNISFI